MVQASYSYLKSWLFERSGSVESDERDRLTEKSDELGMESGDSGVRLFIRVARKANKMRSAAFIHHEDRSQRQAGNAIRCCG